MLDHRLDSKLLKTRDSYILKLKEMDIKTLRDLLTYFPRAYRDEQEFTRINEMRTDEVNVIQVKIKSMVNIPTRAGGVVTRAVVADSTGELPVMWFNQRHLKQLFFKGSDIILTGKIKFEKGRSMMMSPKYEKPSKVLLHTGRIVPVYPESEEITSKWLREKIYSLLPYAKFFDEYLPHWVLDGQRLMSYSDAIYHVHFAKDEEFLNKARERLAFDELFMLQFMALRRKKRWQEGFTGDKKLLTPELDMQAFFDALPFELTSAQKRTIEEIFGDLKRDFPMLRLIQGDVGSGKTAVAAAAIFAMVKSGYQCVLMAPTEILAKQHFKNLTTFLSRFGFNIQLLVGSMSASEHEDTVRQLATGTCDLVIGTHAIIQEGVSFARLGLVVIDEQHRFGVKQRAKLKAQGFPHLLNLSATPIPRTMALTIYGDQDLSILDELPPGRTPIVTRLVPEHKRSDAEFWVSDQVAKGRQVFVVCPLIEESEAVQVKAATLEFDRLRTEVFPNHRLALLHGRMKGDEKAEVMQNFAVGDIDILVSTSVIEVGIDVPNATIMMIEGADRFGLAQLHQFRGRVGRGAHQSYCFLFTDSGSDEALRRLKYMVEFNSGFDLAEKDLEVRGPGEIYGVKQSGIPDLKMATFGDKELLDRVRACAQRLVDEDPNLIGYPVLAEKVAKAEAQMEITDQA
ncbi:ATP-dependent DNA helicase RecG [Candidatus Peregrinibacteria bacterium]|nr:MAG: ATP-dependent DNA helicase RecG [Candidatus Peregrinibacteria bacterium]